MQCDEFGAARARRQSAVGRRAARAACRGFGAVPAIRAKLLLGQTDRADQIVHSLVLERSQPQFLADVFHHRLVARRVGVGKFGLRRPVLAVERLDRPPRRDRDRNAIAKLRNLQPNTSGGHQAACGPHERRSRLSKRIVSPLPRTIESSQNNSHQLTDRDQLHLRHQIADRLVLGHEAPRPGRSVLHERPAVRDPDAFA